MDVSRPIIQAKKYLTTNALIQSRLQSAAAELEKSLKAKPLDISWLAGDGSDRSYYRIKGPKQQTWVLMDLPENDQKKLLSGTYEWIEIGNILTQNQIFVPKLFQALPDLGFLVIEDYGDTMIETRLLSSLAKDDISTATSIYNSCFEVLVKFLKIKSPDRAVWKTRRFDLEKYQWELDFFLKKFFEPLVETSLDFQQKAALEKDFLKLSGFLASQPLYFVHRDFHSRNIMWKDHNYAIIDFQDARLGTICYDLISLTFDPYIPLSKELRTKLLETGIKEISTELPGARRQLEEIWQAVFIQRQLKAIGSYGYLTIDKNKGDYLKYVRPAIESLVSHVNKDDRWPFLSGNFLSILEGANFRKQQ